MTIRLLPEHAMYLACAVMAPVLLVLAFAATPAEAIAPLILGVIAGVGMALFGASLAMGRVPE